MALHDLDLDSALDSLTNQNQENFASKNLFQAVGANVASAHDHVMSSIEARRGEVVVGLGQRVQYGLV